MLDGFVQRCAHLLEVTSWKCLASIIYVAFKCYKALPKGLQLPINLIRFESSCSFATGREFRDLLMLKKIMWK